MSLWSIEDAIESMHFMDPITPCSRSRMTIFDK